MRDEDGGDGGVRLEAGVCGILRKKGGTVAKDSIAFLECFDGASDFGYHARDVAA